MATLIVTAEFMAAENERLVPSLVALSVYDVSRNKQAVYYTSDADLDNVTDDCAYKVRNEKEILIDFWSGAKEYDVFVTYSGRAFFWPYIYNLSAVHGVQPTVQIARERYLSQQTFPYHVDLFDEFTFYKEMKPWPSLQELAEFYGLESVEIGREEMVEFFRQKKFHHLATNTAQQNHTLNELYKIWLQHLAPTRFLNIVD